VILTLDFGSSVTKAAVWDRSGLVALAGSPVTTSHPAPGCSEQQPSEWWASLTAACARLRAQAPEAYRSVDVVGCTGARQSLVLADADAEALGPAILWSDRRAVGEAEALRRSLGSAAATTPFGIPLDAGSVAAKIAWLAAHHPARLEASAWVLAPRDLVAWWLTGTVATDASMAWRSGLYDETGRVVGELSGPAGDRLAPVLPSDQVTGSLVASAAEQLGLLAGTPVVVGAGDRACEVLGSSADETWPMVSWGTTANVSLPVAARPDRPPAGLVVSRAATGGWLLEGGLSAAGSLVSWFGELTGRTPEELAALAATSPPGARGLVATSWLDGARAPWWHDDAGAALVGMSSSHGPADLARAVFESVAWDLQRCLEAMAGRRPEGPRVSGLALGGAGATIAVWLDVLSGITGLPAVVRRSGQAASAGAALLAAAAVGIPCDPDRLDPVVQRIEVDATVASRYLGQREAADRVAAAVIGLTGSPGAPAGGPRGTPCA
jgi:xylulokinase